MKRYARVGLTAIVATGLLAVGPATTADVAPGDVHAFGGDAFGQLGNGASGSHVDKGPAVLFTASDVAGGREHALALVGDAVYAWGSDAHGQVGNGSSLSNAPAPVTAVTSGATAITTGHYHSLALLGGGSTVRAWGWNNRGQLGTASGTNVALPRSISFSGSPVVQVAAGRAHSLALRADGTVWTWGDNTFGQLGYGRADTAKHPTPVQVTGLPPMAFLAGGRDTTFALTAGGDLWVWGNSKYGQAGTGTTSTVLTPTRVTTLSGIRQVESGADHTVAVTDAGTVWTWGRNRYGQLGYSGSTNRTRPVQVTSLSEVAEVYVGRDHSIALGADGSYRTWGRNDGGQLGVSPASVPQTSTPRLLPDLTGTRDAGGGQVHTVVLGG